MIKKFILLLTLAILSTSIFAQGMRGMAGMMYSPSGLLRRDDVKAELQLSDDQKNKLAELADAMRQKFMDARQSAGEDRDAMRKALEPIMAEANESVLKVLTPDQQKRLTEIKYQIAGASLIATDKDLQTALSVTPEELTKMSSIKETADAANTSVGEKMRSGELDREGAMAAFKKNGDALNAAIEGVLTDAQKAKFKTLQGKVFTQTSQPGGFGRGGG